MSNKGQGIPSQQAATTPRRLRSGTHFGDTTQQPPVQPRKDSKKTGKEISHDSVPESERCKPNKTTKSNSTNHEDKILHRSKSYSPSGSASSSPQQLQKGQTLKAILESIKPNFSLRSKPSKRRTLRDILDQKMCQQKQGKSNTKALEKPTMSDKSSNTFQNNHHYKNHVDRDIVKDKQREEKETSERSEENTTHTQTSTDGRSFARVKEELPDDYWAMRQNYTDKNASRITSVELRIKAEGHEGKVDDHSQTFRISCSRPQSSEHSPAAYHRDIKPDIVLKVRPRSCSLSALRDSKRLGEAGKTTGRSHGCPESQSTLLSTISPLSVKANSGYSNGLEHRYNFSNSNLKTHRMVLPDGPVVLKRGPSAARSLDFDQLGQQDVVEESNLPPVANTVELLSEPHDYQHGQHDSKATPLQLTDCSLTSDHSNQAEEFSEQDSPEPPVLEPMTLIKTEPCPDSDSFLYQDDRFHSRVKEEALEVWTEGEVGSLSLNQRAGQEFLAAGSSPVTSAFPKQEKEETEEEGSSRADDDEGGDNEDGDDDDDDDDDEDAGCMEAAVRRIIARRKSKENSDKEFTTHSALSAITSDDAGSRGRRKGRPVRKAKTERKWQTADLCLSPQEEEFDDEEVTHKASQKHRHGKAVSKSASFHTKKGSSKKQGEAGSGVRRPRKSVELEALWADPQLDTHAFLLWASENRCEMEKQNREVSAGGVEDLLAAQWRQLSFASKLHFLCRAREASSDHREAAGHKKKAAAQKKVPPPTDGRSVYEDFLRLPQERQKDLLRKWLRFFQKMLPRLEYQDFIGDFKKACKSLQLRPVPSRQKNARLRNLDPSHYHMLFEKIRETRPRVISVYNKRKAREEELLKHSFNAMIRRLIAGQPWPFVRGCRSKLLGELVKDIQQLEVEEVLSQIDIPLSLTPADLPDPFTGDPGTLTSDTITTDSASGDPGHSLAGGSTRTTNNSSKDSGLSRKGSSSTGTNTINLNSSGASSGGPTSSNSLCPSACSTALGLCGGPAGDAELPDSPFVLNVLDGLRHASDLPLLDQKCLDSVFLGPPSRSRSQNPRENLFQNSATYRRTLLYKHIQPLLDTRGMPLPSSALFHPHTAQYFYPDDM